jgi:hypothetical protein
VLSDREVTPQLGLLKSTLLQLDSTFSERTYGVGSFRDFAQKLAAAGHVTLREAGRNVLVELKEEGAHHRRREQTADPGEAAEAAEAPQAQDAPQAREAIQPVEAAPLPEPRAADGIREIRRLFQAAQNPPRWPMYVRQAKQFLRNVDANFDERKFGFGNITDLFRACQREGLFRVERDRQGVIRLFPGNVMQPIAAPIGARPMDEDDDNRGNVAPPAPPPDDTDDASDEASAEAEVVDGDVVREVETPQVVDGVEAAPAEPPPPARGARGRGRTKPPAQPKPAEGRRPRKTGEQPATPRARKTAAKPRSPRGKTKGEG